MAGTAAKSESGIMAPEIIITLSVLFLMILAVVFRIGYVRGRVRAIHEIHQSTIPFVGGSNERSRIDGEVTDAE